MCSKINIFRKKDKSFPDWLKKYCQNIELNDISSDHSAVQHIVNLLITSKKPVVILINNESYLISLINNQITVIKEEKQKPINFYCNFLINVIRLIKPIRD